MRKKTNVFKMQKSRKKLALLLSIAFILFGLNVTAQNIVTGKVTDMSGSPIPGANVVVKGTMNGTITNFDGDYSINTPADAALLFTFIGFKQMELPVNNQSVINISLSENTNDLEEVVVVGYGVQKKRDLTGSLSQINAEQITAMPITTTEQALQGQVSGVQVTSSSGSPGTGMSVRIRGIGTINNSEPLYVVDGFPVDGIDFLNPSDIESMDILKDASACAIYGARGANGVVLITTKSGSSDRIIVNFDSYYGWQNMWKKPTLCNAEQWAMLNNEARRANNQLPDDRLLDYQSLGNGTDWIDEVTRQALIQSYNISVSGGNNKSTYFLSTNYFGQEGIVKGSDFERISFRLNTNNKITDWLSVGENLTVESNTRHNVNENDEWNAILIEAVAIDPVTTVFTEDGSNYASSPFTDMKNPVAHIARTNTENKGFRVLGNAFANITFSDFTFNTNLGLSFSHGNLYDYFPTYYHAADEQNSVPAVQRGYDNGFLVDFANTLTYMKDFGKHGVTAMVGHTVSSNTYEWFGVTANNLVNQAGNLIFIDNAADRTSANAYGSQFEERILSVLGRVNYSYDGKYLFTANIRRDGSSKFGAKNRYGVFPSFSAGWNVSRENFLANSNIISYLKVRAGWGQIGNDKIPAYQYSTQASTGQIYVFGNQVYDGMTFLSSGNNEIRWETTTSTNVGLDFGVFNNRFMITADYFIKNTTDMLVQAPVLAHVGLQTEPWVNVGEMKNTGLELELTYRNSVSSAFSYELKGNISTYNNEVISLGEGETSIDHTSFRNAGTVSRTQVGMPIGQFYGYVTDGLFQNWDEVNAHTYVDASGTTQLVQPDAAPGDIRYKDVNGDGELDRDFIGNPLPDFIYGFTATVRYKNFDAQIFLQGVQGNDVFNASRFYSDRTDVAHNLHVRMLDRWTGEGSTNNVWYPRLNAGDANNTRISDRFVEDGSYVRIKNLQIGYTLPAVVAQKMKIENCRIYLGAKNLLTFTKYTGFDPEVGEGYEGSLDLGVDRATYPQARTILVGVGINF